MCYGAIVFSPYSALETQQSNFFSSSYIRSFTDSVTIVMSKQQAVSGAETKHAQKACQKWMVLPLDL